MPGQIVQGTEVLIPSLFGCFLSECVVVIKNTLVCVPPITTDHVDVAMSQRQGEAYGQPATVQVRMCGLDQTPSGIAIGFPCPILHLGIELRNSVDDLWIKCTHVMDPPVFQDVIATYLQRLWRYRIEITGTGAIEPNHTYRHANIYVAPARLKYYQ